PVGGSRHDVASSALQDQGRGVSHPPPRPLPESLSVEFGSLLHRRTPAMSGPIVLESLDLAALLCSRVCHDLISPVGAINNGLEVLEEAKDEETRTFALELIKKSARQGSAKLQFCRLAFGAAGSAGAQIDLGDAEKVARGFLE